CATADFARTPRRAGHRRKASAEARRCDSRHGGKGGGVKLVGLASRQRLTFARTLNRMQYIARGLWMPAITVSGALVMRLLHLLLAFVLSFPFVNAQTATGTITGTIGDPAGAVVANAPLELTNSSTGSAYQAATSSTGNFTFTQLPVGTYELKVTVAGFKT